MKLYIIYSHAAGVRYFGCVILGVKMILRITTKNHAADPEIEFLTKSISKLYGRVTAMPPVMELKFNFVIFPNFFDIKDYL